jgi:citryl-CoA lyase
MENLKLNDLVKFKGGKRCYKVAVLRRVNVEGKMVPLYTLLELNTDGKTTATADELEKIPITEESSKVTIETTRERVPFHWKTAIGYTTSEQIILRGYDLVDLAKYCSFADVVYLLYTGRLPTSGQSRMLNYIMVQVQEHGAGSPSPITSRMVMSGRSPLNAAMAAGIQSFGTAHGPGFIASTMFYKYVQLSINENKSLEEVAKILVEKEGPHVSGYHHPQHLKGDPRAKETTGFAKKLGVAGDHIRLSELVEDELERKRGKRVYINVLGAGAASILDIGLEPYQGWCSLAICRGYGGCGAHAIEEMERGNPLRISGEKQIHDVGDPELQDAEYYDGPPTRQVPKNRWPGIFP